MFKLNTQNSSSFASEWEDHSGVHVISTDWRRVIEDFKRIHLASFQNETFVWEIRVNYWYMVSQRNPGSLYHIGNIIDAILPEQMNRDEYTNMLPTESKFPSIQMKPERAFLTAISRGCTYVKLDYSPGIKLMQQSLEREIRRQSEQRNDDALVGLLHLRRGDTTHICDTSVEKVKSYLQCSLGGSEGIRNLTLVMTSEEKDVRYRKSILGLVDEFPHLHLAILDGDEMAQRIVDDAARLGHVSKSMVNGFVVFATEGALRNPDSELVRFRLVRRREHRCPDCDPGVYRAINPSMKYRFDGNQLHMEPIA